jgi:hypothetical protein
MKISVLAALAGAMGLAAVSTAASAQVGFGVYVGPGPGYDYDYYDAPAYAPPAYGPRVYGYTQYGDDDVVVRRESRRRGGCGTYRYWDGDRCVDARYRKP